MMKRVSRDFLRCIRGKRSQEAFSRKLGYTSNPVADWEAGRRSPTAAEALRASQLAGIDVQGAFEAFATRDNPRPTTFDAQGLADWLNHLRGRRSLAQIGRARGCSRSCVSRWLSGRTQPRLPDFFHLIDTLTGRLDDLVAALVDIECVPDLAADFRRKRLAQTVAFEHPWTEGILRLLETEDYRRHAQHPPGWLAERLQIPLAEEEACLARLVLAGVVELREIYVTAPPLTSDSGRDAEQVWAVKRHWVEASAARVVTRSPGDLYSYNIVSVSRADLDRLREMHIQYFKDVRALVGESKPVEVAAMVLVQLVEFAPEIVP